MILCNQDMAERQAAHAWLVWRLRRQTRSCAHYRQRDCKHGTPARIISQRDPAAKSGCQPFGNRQAKAGAAMRLRRGSAGLLERIEHACLVCVGNTAARIGHGHAQCQLSSRVDSAERNADMAVLGKFQRIAHQVEQDLADAHGIGFDTRNTPGIDMDAQIQPLAGNA